MENKSKYYCENLSCVSHLNMAFEKYLKGRAPLSGCNKNFKKYSTCKDNLDKPTIKQKLKVMSNLKRNIGNEAFDSLLNKESFLFQWRRTSPHNYWIADKNGENQSYHSQGNNRPSTMAFEELKNSDKKIAMSLFGSENGLPEQTVWKLRENFIDTYKTSLENLI